MEDLKKQLEKMEAALGASRKRETASLHALKDLEEKKTKEAASPAISSTPVYVTSRTLQKFRDRPVKPTDMVVHEWIGDMKAHLDGLTLSKPQKAAAVMEHLTGRARLEIQGRGKPVISDPDEIFKVLRKVFSDGDSLEDLTTKFYSYEQKPTEDLLTLSLELLSIHQRMVEGNPSLENSTNSDLKARLAGAVKDESLKRELRRLNVEAKSLSYFELRDRAVEWLGSNFMPKQKVAIQELPTAIDPVMKLVQSQGEILKSLVQELKTLKDGSSYRRKRRGFDQNGRRVCFECQSPDHMVADCPVKTKKNTNEKQSLNE